MAKAVKKKKNPVLSVASLEAKVQRLEHAVLVLSRTLIPHAAAVEAGEGVANVKLTKTDDSADFVQVTRIGHPGLVIHEGQTEGTINGAPIGRNVSINVYVKGNPGDVATLDVVGAIPAKVSVAIPLNKGEIDDSRSLYVVGVES